MTVGVHERLQDEGGGHPIHGGGALFDAGVGFAHQAVGLHRGESLVPEMDGEREAGAEFVGKDSDFFSLRTGDSGETERKSDDDFRNVVVADDARELLEVGPLVATLEGFDTLGGNAQQVGDGHSDAFMTDVEPKQTAMPESSTGRRIRAHSSIIGVVILLKRMATDPLNFPAGPKGEQPQFREVDAPTLPRVMAVNSLATTVIAIVAVGAALYFMQLVCVVLLVSLLLAFVLEPVVRLLSKLRVPRGLGAMIAVLLFLFGLYWLGNVSYNRAVDFSQELPKYRADIQKFIWKYRRKAEVISQNTQSVMPQNDDGKTRAIEVQQPSGIWSTLTSNLGTATEVIFAASFVPFLAFFMLSWQEHARRSTVLLFRRELRSTAYATLGAITEMIRAFIVGNFLVGVFIGLISTAVFGLMGVPYFYFVGFISGFLSLVPYLGVLLAFVPPLLAGLGVIHGTGFLVIGATVLGLHLFSLNVLYPKFLGSRLQLNPLAVTVALLFWGWIWGAMGLLLAIPMTAAMKIVFDHIVSLRAFGEWLGE